MGDLSCHRLIEAASPAPASLNAPFFVDWRIPGEAAECLAPTKYGKKGQVIVNIARKYSRRLSRVI
jgi:hypothetical protein